MPTNLRITGGAAGKAQKASARRRLRNEDALAAAMGSLNASLGIKAKKKDKKRKK
jgi:hypothetical protein